MTAEAELEHLVAAALAEDLGAGDVTAAATVPADARGTGSDRAEAARRRLRLRRRPRGLPPGRCRRARRYSSSRASGGRRCQPQLAFISGPARALLAAERTALNLLGHLSGIATLTARYVEAARAASPSVAILDTRKTTPGLRALEKAAVRAGGGRNHRMGLYDAILIKENHVALAGGLTEAVAAARAAEPELAGRSRVPRRR